MTGGMLLQHNDLVEVIRIAQQHGRPVAVGGPGVTSVPDGYRHADFQVLGEAEGIIDKFIAAWERGERKGVFEAEKFTADVTKSPIPRFDLLNFDNYLYIGVQFSRGCPFTCEFCDIIELYGRVPRAKTNAQMLAELDRLYELGYRGHVDFVDDNLIGNKKAVKAFLPELARWLDAHGFPFEFTTEASLNLADDPELLRLMNEANFFGVFVGIESPDPETLIAMRKKQNTRRNIAESMHRIYARRHVRHRGVHRRLRQRERLDRGRHDRADRGGRDPGRDGRTALRAAEHAARAPARAAKAGCTRCPSSFRAITATSARSGSTSRRCARGARSCATMNASCSRIYEPEAFAGRLRRLAGLLDNSNRKRQTRASDARRKLGGVAMLQRLVAGVPEPREVFRQALSHCLVEQSAVGALAHLADGALSASRAVLAPRDPRDRAQDRAARCRAGHRARARSRRAGVVCADSCGDREFRNSVALTQFAAEARDDGAANHDQRQLFYSFCLDEVVPDDHLVRAIASVLDLSWVHKELAPYYSTTGHPSIDPVLIRMLIVGYVFVIRSERALCRQRRGVRTCGAGAGAAAGVKLATMLRVRDTIAEWISVLRSISTCASRRRNWCSSPRNAVPGCSRARPRTSTS